jgi:hypothetical protein
MSTNFNLSDNRIPLHMRKALADAGLALADCAAQLALCEICMTPDDAEYMQAYNAKAYNSAQLQNAAKAIADYRYANGV